MEHGIASKFNVGDKVNITALPMNGGVILRGRVIGYYVDRDRMDWLEVEWAGVSGDVSTRFFREEDLGH